MARYFDADAGQWSTNLSNVLLSEPLIGRSELSAILDLLGLDAVAALVLDRLCTSVAGLIVGAIFW